MQKKIAATGTVTKTAKRRRRPAYERPSKPNDKEEAKKIRDIIERLKDIISLDRILYTAKNLARTEIPMTRSSLDEFMRDEERGLKTENLAAFKKFFFKTFQGRALLSLAFNQDTQFDRLATRLMNVNDLIPGDLAIEGLYFLYHASYIREGGYVARLIEITRGESSILNVTDTCRDVLIDSKKIDVAYGCAILVQGRIQLIMNSVADRRHGIGLIVANEPVPSEDNKLAKFFGAFSGISQQLKPFQRYCMAVRCDVGAPNTRATTYEALRKEMADQTGFFELVDGDHHSEAISDFADGLDEPIFKDPILSHPKFQFGTKSG